MQLLKGKKACVVSCLHAPLQDQNAFEKARGIVRREKPDVVVCLGDLLESNAASRWDDAKELEIHLKAEFQAGNELLRQLRESAPAGAEFVVLEGNHESNIMEPGRIDRRVRGLCDWTDPQNIPEMEFWKVGAQYEYDRLKGAYRLSQQVVCGHGFETGAGPIKREAFYFADEWGLYVHGHTHRPTEGAEQIVWTDMPLRRWVMNVGCLRGLKPQYMKRKRTWNWGHAVGIIEYMPLKSPRAGREWSAHNEIIGMYDRRAAA